MKRSHFFGFLLLISSLSLTTPLQASFIGFYDPANWTVTNVNSDGSIGSPDSGMTLVVTGPNNGSGNPGNIDVTTFAPSSGMVSFTYSYSSLDTPAADDAGYLLNGVYTMLADTNGESGTAAFAVTAGESFGFRVESVDNTGEPGIISFADFSAPAPASPVPEPAALELTSLGAGFAIGLARWLRRK